MNIVGKLEVGERKALGEAVDVAEFVSSNPKKVSSLTKVLLAETANNVIVSHGFYALKEACVLNPSLQ